MLWLLASSICSACRGGGGAGGAAAEGMSVPLSQVSLAGNRLAKRDGGQ